MKEETKTMKTMLSPGIVFIINFFFLLISNEQTLKLFSKITTLKINA